MHCAVRKLSPLVSYSGTPVVHDLLHFTPLLVTANSPNETYTAFIVHKFRILFQFSQRRRWTKSPFPPVPNRHRLEQLPPPAQLPQLQLLQLQAMWMHQLLLRHIRATTLLPTRRMRGSMEQRARSRLSMTPTQRSTTLLMARNPIITATNSIQACFPVVVFYWPGCLRTP